jgi:RsiW-degrading membrane proteinase PrsW (M82 family)
MITGWRARLHYWSRRADVLKKLSVGIVLGAFALAWIMTQTQPDRSHDAVVDPVEQAIRKEWQRLRNATEPTPRALARWLRKLLPSLKVLQDVLEMEMPDDSSYAESGKLLAYDVRPLIEKHVSTGAERQAFEDYIAAYLFEKGKQNQEAVTRLRDLAVQEKPPPFANEFQASLLLRTDHDADALAAMIREGSLFADAKQARETAVHLALSLKDDTSLQKMMSNGWLDDVPPILEHEAGIALGDLAMQWRGLLKHRFETVPYLALTLTALAAGLWYVLLVMHSPMQPWRWSWPIAPIVAGIASIWPTVSMIAWQEDTMGIGGDDVPFPYDLWHLIIGVGFREEICKLALASLFMPWLVWQRIPAMALMTGAFVGLGFALEENMDYYADYGNGVALPRFLSANFMHIAMTGLTTHALYDMLRSRFHRTQEFISTFALIVLAHAVYDYDAPEITGLSSYVPMLILALLAWRFWDEVEKEMPQVRQTISPAAIFLVGSAVVIAVSLIITAGQDGSWLAVVDAAKSCASILPVAVIYWRRFEGALTSR